ncbi:MAG TPA: hypothetical protein VGS02_10890 [Acidobacteriaceae bacterium]|nr:hypothetical protein [Acidobacteriaceae bacterium]
MPHTLLKNDEKWGIPATPTKSSAAFAGGSHHRQQRREHSVSKLVLRRSRRHFSFFQVTFLRYLIVPAWLVQHTNPNKVTQKCPQSTFL